MIRSGLRPSVGLAVTYTGSRLETHRESADPQLDPGQTQPWVSTHAQILFF